MAIALLPSSVTLRLNIVAANNFHVAIEEILISEDDYTKSHNLNLSNPHEALEVEI